MLVGAAVREEDTGNYTCELRGPRSWDRNRDHGTKVLTPRSWDRKRDLGTKILRPRSWHQGPETETQISARKFWNQGWDLGTKVLSTRSWEVLRTRPCYQDLETETEILVQGLETRSWHQDFETEADISWRHTSRPTLVSCEDLVLKYCVMSLTISSSAVITPA